MFIKEVKARQIKDSRGEPTIEISVNNSSASSPSGKSTGKYETPCYRNSLGWNINFLNKTVFDLEVKSFNDLEKMEFFIRKTARLKDAKQFGANALFALECATLKALAREQKKELWQIISLRANKMPVPVGNAVGGGLHSSNKSKPVFQEFLLIPQGKSAAQNYQIIKNVHHKLKKILNAEKVNDEGAWETSLSEEGVLSVLSSFKNIRVGVDVASSTFYKNSKYHYKKAALSAKEQMNYINELIKKFNLFYVEDPLDEKDFSGFAGITRSPNNLVVGDDLTATHISRLKKAISKKSINAMIIKPNQNGSLLELKEIFDICRRNNIKTVLSHRSGETLDNALADLAVGFGADFIKCGIATRWREAKLKRLVEIEKNNN